MGGVTAWFFLIDSQFPNDGVWMGGGGVGGGESGGMRPFLLPKNTATNVTGRDAPRLNSQYPYAKKGEILVRTKSKRSPIYKCRLSILKWEFNHLDWNVASLAEVAGARSDRAET